MDWRFYKCQYDKKKKRIIADTFYYMLWSLLSEHEGVHIPLWLQPTSKENTKGKNPVNRF
jgi:hypothetical protein